MATQKPFNYGAKWTEDERTLVIKYLKRSEEIETIAEKLNRSIGGVDAEIQKIVYNKYKDGVSSEDISNELNLTFASVQSIIKNMTRKYADQEIAYLEKENKLILLKIENLKLQQELKKLYITDSEQ